MTEHNRSVMCLPPAHRWLRMRSPCGKTLGGRLKSSVEGKSHSRSTSYVPTPNEEIELHPPAKSLEIENRAVTLNLNAHSYQTDGEVSIAWPNGTARPPLLQLPPELIQHIASLLEVEWNATLALSCKHLLHALGTSSFTKTWAQPSPTPSLGSRQPFLKALVRDLQDAFEYCDYCNSLHSLLKLHPPRDYEPSWAVSGNRPKPLCVARDGIMYCAPGYGKGGAEGWWRARAECGKNGFVLLRRHLRNVVAETPRNQRRGAIEGFDADLAYEHPAVGIKEVAIVRADWVGSCVILKTERRFSALTAGGSMRLNDLFALQIRICPHQVTGNEVKRRTLRDCVYAWARPTARRQPTLLLSHAIAAAWPRRSQRRHWFGLGPATVRPTTIILEQNQMQRSDRKPGDRWICRSCATKFCVEYDTHAEQLVLTVYQRLLDADYWSIDHYHYRRDTDRFVFDAQNNSEWEVDRRPWLVDFACDQGDLDARMKLAVARANREKIAPKVH